MKFGRAPATMAMVFIPEEDYSVYQGVTAPHSELPGLIGDRVRGRGYFVRKHVEICERPSMIVPAIGIPVCDALHQLPGRRVSGDPVDEFPVSDVAALVPAVVVCVA